MMAALAIGLVLGFASSTPLGPINLHIARRRFEDRSARIFPFVLGVVVADLIVASLALGGLLAAHLSSETLRAIGLIGGGAFIAYGAFGLWRAREEDLKPAALSRFSSDLTMGFLFCGLNPGFYLFWVYGASILLSTVELSTSTAVLFTTGVLAGDALWFYFFLKLMGWAQPIINRRVWSMGTFALTMAIGSYAIWRSLHGTF